MQKENLPVFNFVKEISLQNDGKLKMEDISEQIIVKIREEYPEEAVEIFRDLLKWKVTEHERLNLLRRLEESFDKPNEKYLTLTMLDLKNTPTLIRVLTKIKLEYGEQKAQVLCKTIDNLRSMPNLTLLRVIDVLELKNWDMQEASCFFRVQHSEK